MVEYYRNRSDNVTSSFPLLTPAIEAAFPDRVTRDANGVLTALDLRPVTFAQTRSQRLRYGFNIFGKLGKPYAEGEAPANSRGSLFSAIRGATGPSSSRSGEGQGDAQRSGGAGGGRSGFDPARMAAMREKLCATPEGQAPDLTGVPEGMQARLKDENGNIDPAKVAVMRERFCSADAAQRFDPAKFAAMRQALCADPAKDPDPSVIPPAVLDRIKGPDGSLDPARLKEFQTRICALPQGAQGASTGENRGEGGSSDQARGGDGGGAERGGRGGRGGGRGGNDGQGRWNLALYHTVNLENSVLIAPGGPFLDLLNGDATGSGGVSRHQFELEGGAFYRGIGARLSGNYSSATDVRGTGLPGSSDLRFGDLVTFDLRMFVALDQQRWLVGDTPGFFNDARVSLRVNNIFDTRQKVTDENGLVPLRYQPFLIDPTGRFVEIEFRKLF